MASENRKQPNLSRRKQALRYAGRGWLVVPMYSIKDRMCSRSKGDACNRPGKYPRTAHGVRDATTTKTQIESWWETWPRANIGIAAGQESGPKEGYNDAGGEDQASPIHTPVDPRSTTPNQPTMSEPLAQTADAADAAEAEKSDLPKATPPNVSRRAADVADAGIKKKSIEFISRRIIGGRPIPVLRHRRHGKAKKPSASKHP